MPAVRAREPASGQVLRQVRHQACHCSRRVRGAADHSSGGTSVRLAEAARSIEEETGVPITSSNHAMAWHALRLAGIGEALPQWGSLFERQIA